MLRLTVRQLYSWPAIPGHTLTPAPDLATGMPVITDNGLKQTVTIRSGLMWNTSPPRPVTAQDVVRGIKRACNPSPYTFGGMADFESAIQGLTAYCSGYPAAAATNAAVMRQYIESHSVSGIAVSGNSITFTLTRPAPWLIGAMTLPPFSAVPIEAENGLPGSPQVYGHMYSDGPYEITSYTPKKSITFARNPQWKASTDPLRKAYVNAINVDETGNQATIYQEMATGSPSLGMSFDALVPPAAYPQLLNMIKSGSHLVNLGATYRLEPVPGLQHRVAEQRWRAGQGSGAPGPLLRDRTQSADQDPRRDRGEHPAHPRPAARHRRRAGRAQRLRPVPVQPGQGQVHARGRGFHREPPAAAEVAVPQRQPGQHEGLHQHRQPAECAGLR